jgi:hypothetical protein
VQFLTNLYNESRGRIPCKPEIKVVEDEHIVGILTMTNQFVQVSDYLVSATINDSLKVLEDGNYILADKIISTTDRIDEERLEYIKRIKMETAFFQTFRNTVRILLNDYSNLKMRETIEEEINNPYALYSAKLNKVIEYLKTLVSTSVIFVDDFNSSLVDKISTCVVVDSNECSVRSPYCVTTSDNKCQLIIPKKNLITGKDNEVYYFGRLADEFIRYNRVKSYIFQPDSYLSFGNINYNLKEDEIIVLQTLLLNDYFVGLDPVSTNNYIEYNTYDNAEPKQTQLYENIVELNEKTKNISGSTNNLRECITKANPKITSNIWNKCFPASFNEIEYEKTNMCGFYLLIDVIKYFYPEKNLSLQDIRGELLEEYNKFLPRYKNQIIDILISEGKKILGDQVKANSLTFQDCIFMDSYFVTNLDLWMIVEKYKIPTIFISSKPILQSSDGMHEFVAHGSKNDKFIFIVLPGLRAENILKFKIVQSSEGEIAFPITIFRSEDCMRNVEKAIEKYQNIESYLKQFTKKPKKAVSLKKKKLVLVQENEPIKQEEEIVEAVLEPEVAVLEPEVAVLEPEVDVLEPEVDVLEPIVKPKTRKRNPGTVQIKKQSRKKKLLEIV